MWAALIIMFIAFNHACKAAVSLFFFRGLQNFLCHLFNRIFSLHLIKLSFIKEHETANMREFCLHECRQRQSRSLGESDKGISRLIYSKQLKLDFMGILLVNAVGFVTSLRRMWEFHYRFLSLITKLLSTIYANE